MRTSVRKWFNNYEKEENWLNGMAAKGWNLVNANPPEYTFEEGTPGEYIYRIALLKHTASHPDTIEHIRFLEETGAEHVTSFWRWVYCRKKAPDGIFEIYTDATSRIEHYKRMINLLGWVWVLQLFGAAIQIPFIIGTLFIRSSMWGLVNVAAAIFVLSFSFWVFKPWVRFRAKVKELEFEREIFE